MSLIENSSKSVKLGTWDFNVIQLEDRELYEWYICQTVYPANLWSSNFAYMWATSQSKQHTLLWKIIDGLLVTFVLSYKNTLYVFCLPFGKAEPEQVIDVMLTSMKYCLDWNKQDKNKSVLKMINESQFDFLKQSQRFERYFTKTTWVGIERHFDIGKLYELKGKDFENIRNRVHKFKKDNPDAKIRPYQESDYEQLMELDARWRSTSGKKYTHVFDTVYYKELVRHGGELGQTTIVVQNNGRIIGMISGGLLPTGQAWGSVVKFVDTYPGLSETLMIEYAKVIHQLSTKVSLMNVGSDLGPGGLREYKLKFRPALNLKRYQIALK